MTVLPNNSQTNDRPITRTTLLSPGEQKAISRGAGIDMSPEAVTRRLDVVDELRELANELANAKRLGPINVAPAINEN